MTRTTSHYKTHSKHTGKTTNGRELCIRPATEPYRPVWVPKQFETCRISNVDQQTQIASTNTVKAHIKHNTLLITLHPAGHGALQAYRAPEPSEACRVSCFTKKMKIALQNKIKNYEQNNKLSRTIHSAGHGALQACKAPKPFETCRNYIFDKKQNPITIHIQNTQAKQRTDENYAFARPRSPTGL